MDQKPGELDDINNGVKTDDDKNEIETITVRSKPTVDTASGEDTANADLTADEPEEILEEIEKTRSSMSETIDAIQEKLSFANISEQVKENVSEQISSAVETAKDAVYVATIKKAENFMQTVTRGLSEITDSAGDAGTLVVQSAKRNPVPFALIGLGVGLLLFQNNKRSTVKRNFRYEGDTGYSSGRGSSRSGGTMLGQAGKTVSGALGSAKDTVGGVAGSAYEGVSSAASSAVGGVSSAASSAYGGVANVANSAYQGATSFVSSTGQQATQVARKVQTQYSQTLEENPLAIGAIALALGAVVGLAIPVTEYENQWMGETKDNLVNQFEGVAREAIGRVQEVAGEVTKQVKDQAQTQGGNA